MHRKTDSEFIRRQNRTLVLESLRAYQSASRTELSEKTSLSPAALSGICGDLVREDLVRETHLANSASRGRGRPRVALTLNPDAALVLAVEIVEATVSITIADYAGARIGATKTSVLQPNGETTDLATRIVSNGADMLAEAGFDSSAISAISVAVQGVVDRTAGTIFWSPTLADRNIPISAPLESAFGAPVILSNDANMLARALHFQRPEEYGETFAVVMVDRGVGAGLFVDGQPHEGAFGAAAEFGHMNHMPDGPLCRCGKNGCLEAFVSDYGIQRLASGDPDAPPPGQSGGIDVQDLSNRARNGDNQQAVQAFAAAGRALGFGLARLVALFDPPRIALTGAALQAWDLMGPQCRAGFDDALVRDLRSHVVIDVLPWEPDYVLNGTILAALTHLDRNVFGHAVAAEPR